MRYFLFCWLLFSFGLCARAQTEEITHLSVDIRPKQDASLDVTETITVIATGEQIKRGITRTLHREPLGKDTDLEDFTYEIIAATRDGSPEPWVLKQRKGLPTLYLGDKDVRLNPGTYTYVVKYRAFDQVYALDRIDEIRWPLEGRSGRLPVREADVTFRFDRDIDIIQSACYTGTFGATATDCEYSQDGHEVTFVATAPLEPGEGMTVAASIAAGYFQRPVPPTPTEKNATLTFLVLGFALAFGYAFTSWQRYGVDPKGPPVRPEYFPPEGLSPAAAAYLLQRWPTARQVTASLTDMAVSGYLTISEEKQEKRWQTYSTFIISPTDQVPDSEQLPPEQSALYHTLLAEGAITLGESHHKKVARANSAHGKALGEAHNAYLKEGNNLQKMLPLAGILLLTFVAAGVALAKTGFGVTALVVAAILAVLLLLSYGILIAKPGLEKVTMRNYLKGLKQYLELSEKERKALPNAPEMTPTYFQQLLPYAIAFGVENDWAEVLSAYFQAGSRGSERSNFAPAFPHTPYLLTGFSQRINQSYSTSAAVPNSGGGGGFSGGGGAVGGGGGTGGW